jgi:UDP-glucose 4-epimerase
MRVLVTGSSGQIGTNLALRLLADGHQVWGVDKRENSWTDAFPTNRQDLASVHVPTRSGINGIDYPPVDVVVHLAAHAKVHQLVRQPDLAVENMLMTFNVLEYCRKLKLPLVFSSTREVYGDVHRFDGYGEATADFAYTESPYSASKIASEGFIYSYAKCYDLRYLVFRFSNVYGRFDCDLQRMERVLPLFMHQLSRGEPITVYGRDKTLDFTYIEDCVDGIVRGIERLHAGALENETVNLAFGEGNRLEQAARLIADELGVDPDITFERSLRGEVTHYVAHIEKARVLLGWQPQTPLAAGIPKAVEWFREWRAAHPEEDREIVPERVPGEIEHAFKPTPV